MESDDNTEARGASRRAGDISRAIPHGPDLVDGTGRSTDAHGWRRYSAFSGSVSGRHVRSIKRRDDYSAISQALVFGGILNGDAPLFERFTLGDSSTLRGWSKFDLAPVGGTRVAHGSLEYTF